MSGFHRSGVAAVVTAFRPGGELGEMCRSVRNQVDLLVVVDDGTGPDADTLLDACEEWGATVVRHSSNRGIAAALNTGLAVVRERASGAAVLTLDQDSKVPAGYVASLLTTADRARNAGLRVAMVAPGQATGVRAVGAGRRDGVVLAREPIQSGLLLTPEVVAAMGKFDEGLFIDGVDTEYWLRARRSGWASVVDPDVQLEHRLGRRHRVRFAGRELAVGYAATFRYYYIARNRVILLRRYGLREPAWAIGAVTRDLRHLAVTTALVPGRRDRWRESLRGWRDGWRGAVGPRP